MATAHRLYTRNCPAVVRASLLDEIIIKELHRKIPVVNPKKGVIDALY